MSPLDSAEAVRILVEALRQSRSSNILDLDKIVVIAKTTEPFAKRTLIPLLDENNEGQFCLDSKTRVELAIEIARAGGLRPAAQALTWQEFESFGAECLAEAGFRGERNIRLKGDGRAWQIDLAGYRGDLVLTIDCKHWSGSVYESRLKPSAMHQRAATIHLLSALMKKTGGRESKLQGLAVILTLSEPPTRFLEDAVLVSVEKLASFLNAVSPYDTSLPLISAAQLLVENPMS